MESRDEKGRCCTNNNGTKITQNFDPERTINKGRIKILIANEPAEPRGEAAAHKGEKFSTSV